MAQPTDHNQLTDSSKIEEQIFLNVMADSLVLKGVKDVRKQTGSEFLRLNPPRGGDTFKIKRWWTPGTVSTVYESCTLFQVTQGGLVCFLAVPTEESSSIRIDVAADFAFSFYDIARIKRAALMTDGMEVIEHYAFPAISGGKIMTVTPPGAPERPSTAPPAKTIDSASLTGELNPTSGDTENYSVDVTGNASPFTYTWTVSGGTIDSGDGTTSVSVTWGAAGSGSLQCEVGSDNADFDGNKKTASLSATIGETFAQRVANADYSYAVTVVDDGGDDVYAIDGNNQETITANANETIHFDLSDASLSGHPFKIYTDSTKTTEVTVGVEQEGDDLLFTPPIAGSFSYQCANHDDMGGDITIS